MVKNKGRNKGLGVPSWCVALVGVILIVILLLHEPSVQELSFVGSMSNATQEQLALVRERVTSPVVRREPNPLVQRQNILIDFTGKRGGFAYMEIVNMARFGWQYQGCFTQGRHTICEFVRTIG